MTANARSGDYRIISSGMLMSFDMDSGVSLDVEDGENKLFTLSFLFEEDESDSPIALQLGYEQGGKSIVLTCRNFNDTLGQSTKRPLELGQHSGQECYLSFLIRSLDERRSPKLIEYTVFAK